MADRYRRPSAPPEDDAFLQNPSRRNRTGPSGRNTASSNTAVAAPSVRPSTDTGDSESSTFNSGELRSQRRAHDYRRRLEERKAFITSQRTTSSHTTDSPTPRDSGQRQEISRAANATQQIGQQTDNKNAMNKSSSHFQAHDTAVEKYLQRSQLVRNIRHRESPKETVTTNETNRERPRVQSEQTRRLRMNSETTPTTPSAYAKTRAKAGTIFRTRAESSPQLPIDELPRSQPLQTESQDANNTTSSRIGLINRSISELPLANRSTLVDTTEPENPIDETMSTTHQAVKGWSTLRKSANHRQRTTEADTANTQRSSTMQVPLSINEVDAYLQSRKRQESHFRDSTAYNTPLQSSADQTEESSDAEWSDASRNEGEDDSSCADETLTEYSVKVCVVSAVDLPVNVVPKIPLSPVLRLGLIKMKHTAQIEAKGLEQLPKARVHATLPKILSKRDNGAAEFHEEFRWNNVHNPETLGLAVELSARAVVRPANWKESPSYQNVQLAAAPNSSGLTRASPARVSSDGEGRAGMGSLFRRNNKEMETANAAAAVAKLLVEGDTTTSDNSFDGEERGPLYDSKEINQNTMASTCQNELDVKLRPRNLAKKPKMTQDLRLGCSVIPLNKLVIANTTTGKQTVRMEQWFELNSSNNNVCEQTSGAAPLKASTRNPSVLLEISFSSPEYMDESENELENDDCDAKPSDDAQTSFSKRASMKIRRQLKKEMPPQRDEEEEPVLEPGIIDYVCVVGARDIGNQKADDGASGWVNSSPECCILEQFPPNDDFHLKNKRFVALPNKVEWFCFPEGCRLWRGTTPPNAHELNLKRFSASSPFNIGSSIAMFDAWLGCTTSFSWFVIASSSDEYGSENAKTYGACIRFFVPAPTGIDQTQDDFAQTVLNESAGDDSFASIDRKRLWVPLGICLTSTLPIVGAMEAILLRLCETLSLKGITKEPLAFHLKDLNEELANLIINYQRPIAGIVQCSLPFLRGERLHLSLPPRTGLPPLPHGNAVSSVCRLLGADGVTYLLAAFLTECKILLHSDDIANLSLVSEVMTSLLYPFSWSLPYIPVLPADMMEFIEAPLSYLLGIPSCNLKTLDPSVVEDVVVVDLDNDFSTSDSFEDQRVGLKGTTPIPLPTNVANNVARAVHRLLRAEEAVERQYGILNAVGAKGLPRIDPESLAEREFRVAVALEISGLVRGYQDCVIYASSSQPVFNTEKFLQTAPALFEAQRIGNQTTQSGTSGAPTKIISPRSRRFLSILVNCQHFHQFLEGLESDHVAFFHEVISMLDTTSRRRDPFALDRLRSDDVEKLLDQLCKSLQKVEDRMPIFRIKRPTARPESSHDTTQPISDPTFPFQLLKPIAVSKASSKNISLEQMEGVKHISLEYLMELEKNPWCYTKLFEIYTGDASGVSPIPLAEKVKLRDAIGERRYRSLKLLNDHDRFETDELSLISDDSKERAHNISLNLSSLVTSYAEDVDNAVEESEEPFGERILSTDARDCDIVRLCLENSQNLSWTDPNLHSILVDAEKALHNPSARFFLLSVLSKRSKFGSNASASKKSRRHGETHGSRLDSGSFRILLHLAFAMLDACMEDSDYNPAYLLLKYSAGLCTAYEKNSDTHLFMTKRLGLHPIYANMGIWHEVKMANLLSRQKDRISENKSDNGATVIDQEKDVYEATVATLYDMLGYDVPSEVLARFASRVCEEQGWFRTERGQSLMLLARRLCIRRDLGEDSLKKKSDIDMIPSPPKNKNTSKQTNQAHTDVAWAEIGWCHPAAQSSRRINSSDNPRFIGTQRFVNILDEQKLPGKAGRSSNYMKRSAVTSMVYIGASVVVTGALDGGVFMARTVSPSRSGCNSSHDADTIRGVHLDWGSSGSRYAVGSASSSMDGEYGVGAVSCLVSTRSTSSSPSHLFAPRPSGYFVKDTIGSMDDEDFLAAMDGCRLVAGTTCGDLRVWSIKDIFSAVFLASSGVDSSSYPPPNEVRRFNKGGEVSSSTLVADSRRKNNADFAGGSSFTRLKFSLRGRALSGHRGGVSCMDVPSNIYRPDSVVSGGADGLIKLWSLRSTGISGGRREMDSQSHMLSTAGTESMSPRTMAARSGDALSILSGHGGRVLCLKAAWHGDRLLSGGADRTVRVWDLAGNAGKCLHSMSGHLGWVTTVRYWGPHTIVSAATDRSAAIWDVRVRNSPLFMLRHHCTPISDLLVGTRADPIMVSAGSDGSVRSWDFRHLSDSSSSALSESGILASNRISVTFREPVSKLSLQKLSRYRHISGPVKLSLGSNLQQNTVFCVGRDAVVREWDVQTGEVISEHVTGHCDTISGFLGLHDDREADMQLEGYNSSTSSGFLSASWDGTVRMHQLVGKGL